MNRAKVNRWFGRPSFIAALIGVLLLVFVGIFLFNRPKPQIAHCREKQSTSCEAKATEVLRIKNPGADELVASYTADLAVITALLVVATVVLGWYTGRLWYATRKMAIDATRTANKTHRQMQREFVAAHPPRLITRRVYWNDPGGTGDPSHVYGPKIYFTIANMGQSRADIVSCTVVKWVAENAKGGLPRVAPMDVGEEKAPFVLGPGEHKDLGYGATQEKLTDKLYRDMLGPDGDPPSYKYVHTLWLLGDISFRDENGTLRQIAFCHRYDVERKRFEPGGDPDYSYNY